jgi:hypothetical protein
MTADAALIAALRDLQAALAAHGRPAMIIGGIAVMARGVPRQTIDIDATIAAEGTDLDELLHTLERHRVLPRVPDALAFARERQVLLLRHEPSGTPLEITLAWLPFELDALARASVVDFRGVPVRVATAEDLVVYKAVAWRERDRSDIERLLVRHHSTINMDAVRRLVRQFADALDEPERIEAFESLLRRSVKVTPPSRERKP